jgi:hypothetical protein
MCRAWPPEDRFAALGIAGLVSASVGPPRQVAARGTGGPNHWPDRLRGPHVQRHRHRVSDAGAEQATGVAYVAQAVAQLEETWRQNAALAEQGQLPLNAQRPGRPARGRCRASGSPNALLGTLVEALMRSRSS